MDSLPPAFVERMTEVLGSREALDALLEASSRRAIRVNRLKTTPSELLARLDALGIGTEPVPWSPDAYWPSDPGDRKLGSLWEHRSGRFFVQDPISTLPVEALDVEPGQAVLDLCAAPGSKATHLAERLDQEGLLVANDKQPGRVNNLISNLDQTGALTVVATQADAARLEWPIAFDRVLVDAPCSNLGNVHRDWEPIRSYAPERVRRLAGTQRSLLTSAFHAVRPGGRIVYSTCTIEPRENEAVCEWFLDAYPVEIEPLDVDVGRPGLTEAGPESFDGAVRAARRVRAGKAGTESFFVAAFAKQAEAPFENPRRPPGDGLAIERAGAGPIREVREAYGLDGTVLDRAEALRTANKTYASTASDLDALLDAGADRAGIYLARPETRGHRLGFPAATLVGAAADRRIELEPDEARAWLAGESVRPSGGVPREWSVVTCRSEALGCSRGFGGKLPSYVPKRYRSPEDPEAELLGFLAREAA